MTQPKNAKSDKKDSMTVHIAMPLEIYEAIKNLAEREDRTLRREVLHLLKRALEPST